MGALSFHVAFRIACQLAPLITVPQLTATAKDILEKVVCANQHLGSKQKATPHPLKTVCEPDEVQVFDAWPMVYLMG